MVPVSMITLIRQFITKIPQQYSKQQPKNGNLPSILPNVHNKSLLRVPDMQHGPNPQLLDLQLRYTVAVVVHRPYAFPLSSELALREVIQFLDMFVKFYIVGVMLLYVLRTRLPLSYRAWSGLNGLSLLLYNAVFYLQYEDQLSLRALSVSNGPYFASYRVMALSTSHIFPTMSLIIIMLALMVLLYFPLTVFVKQRESIIEYIKNEGLHIFDCSYFFASKMMFFYIGKFILQSSTASVVYIVVVAVYGLFILLAWVRLIYKYHEGTIGNFAYDSPIYLYTMLAPTTMIGLPLATSETILVVVYCAPFALLILILLLNRNMKVFTKNNIKFFIVELLMVGLTMAFIFLNDEIKTYILMVIIFGTLVGITVETWILYRSGFEFENKVHPELEDFDQPAAPKKIYGQEKDGYF